MRRYAGLLLLVVCIILTGCSNDKPEAVIENIDGIEYVRNPESPLFPEKTVIFEEELRISFEDDAGNIIIYQPAAFAVSADGWLYVGDGQERNIHVFDSDGKHIRFFSGKGQGPGEFERIGRLAFLSDGRLLAIDWRTRRTSLFNREGEYLGGHTWRNSHFEIYWIDEDSYTVDDRAYGGDATILSVKTFSLEGEERTSFGEFTPFRPHIVTQGEYSFGITIPYDPHSIFTGDRKNKYLYHCLNDRYSIEVYDMSGKLFRIIERPYTPVPFTDLDRQDYYDSVDQNPNKIYGQMARDVELPQVKTITESMVVDDLGNLWVATFETRNEGEDIFTAYDIFSKDGKYTARVWSVVNPYFFQDGKMYAYAQSDEGYRTLIRYAVKWRDEPTPFP